MYMFLLAATTSTRKFREASQEVKTRLEIALHPDQPGSDWRALGLELGFSEAELASFDSQASEEHVPSCRCLLERWSAKSHSTVGALARALHKLGRRDLVLLLREERQPCKEVIKTPPAPAPAPEPADLNSPSNPVCQV